MKKKKKKKKKTVDRKLKDTFNNTLYNIILVLTYDDISLAYPTEATQLKKNRLRQ